MPALYLYPACGLVLMILTWPTGRSGRRVLRRWSDVGQPSADQTAIVVRYLRERRILVVPLMFLAPLTARATPALLGSASDLGAYHLLGSLLVAWLLAETLAGLWPRRGAVRSASLVRRGWRGLLPRWAVGLHLGLTAVAVVFAVAVLAMSGVGWYLMAVAGAGLVVVYGIAWLAVLRPAAADDRVDGALRVRSARVAVGVGVLLSALLISAGAARLSSLARFSHAPGWLDGLAPVSVWVSVALFGVALVGWGGVIGAPRYG